MFIEVSNQARTFGIAVYMLAGSMNAHAIVGHEIMQHRVKLLDKVTHSLSPLLRIVQRHCTQSRISHKPQIRIVGPCISSTFSFLDTAPCVAAADAVIEEGDYTEITVYFPELSEQPRSVCGRYVVDYKRSLSIVSQRVEFDSDEYNWAADAAKQPSCQQLDASNTDPAMHRAFNEPHLPTDIVRHDLEELENAIQNLLDMEDVR